MDNSLTGKLAALHEKRREARARLDCVVKDRAAALEAGGLVMHRSFEPALATAFQALVSIDSEIRITELECMIHWHEREHHLEAMAELDLMDCQEHEELTVQRRQLLTATAFIGRSLLHIARRATGYDFDAWEAEHLQMAIQALKEGRSEDVMRLTEQANLPAKVRDTNGAWRRTDRTPTRWELGAELVEIATGIPYKPLSREVAIH